MNLIPKVKVTYQGKTLSLRFYNEHPEIQHMYPSKEMFVNKIYWPAFQKMRQTNINQIIEIAEHSVKINGVAMLV